MAVSNSKFKIAKQVKTKILGNPKSKKIKKSNPGSIDKPHKSPMVFYNDLLLDIKNNQTIVGQSKKSIRKQKFNRIVGVTNESNYEYINTINISEEYTTPIIKLNNEAIPFLFHLNGCAKNLLLFIITCILDGDTGCYRANAYVFKIFIEYAHDIFGEVYKLDTVKQCHRELVEKNITCNVSTGIYNINPLIVSMGNDAKKRQMFKDYTELLIRKKKDPVMNFYPILKNKLI